jgi:hypothetical protein
MTHLANILSNALEPARTILLRAPERWAPRTLARAFERIGADCEKPLVDPLSQDRYADALTTLLEKGSDELGRFEHIILAYNLALPHERLQGRGLLSDRRLLASLLEKWVVTVRDGGGSFIWRGALLSYFRGSPDSSAFPALRQFLSETLSSLGERKVRPVWLQVVTNFPNLLLENPAEDFAQLWFNGESTEIDKLRNVLDIPDGSWFWAEFVGAVLSSCCDTPDDSEFRGSMETVLGLLGKFEQHADIILRVVVNRYALCHGAPRDDRLLALVLDAWGSPQLGFDGNKHKWAGATNKATEMVCSWLAEEDLEDFREYCRGDESVDDRRLAYWLRFKKQITFSRLVLGRSIWNARDRRTQEFIRRKRGRLSQMTSTRNALILRIGKWWFIEFSEKGKACCPYREGCGYEFDFSLPTYSEGQLRSVDAIEASGGRRLIHRGDWEADFDSFLASKRIWPDDIVMARASERSRVQQLRAEHEATGKLRPPPDDLTRGSELKLVIESLDLDYGSANHLRSIASAIADNRVVGGRLWIELSGTPSNLLQNEMVPRGYRYAAGRGFYWNGI